MLAVMVGNILQTMKRTRFLILITSILILASCSQEHKELYPNGNVKRIYKTEKGLKTGLAVEFYASGDTSLISNYKNGLLDGKQIIFGNDSSFFSKRILNYKNDKLNGEGLEYVNDSLRFRMNYVNDLKQGDFYGYFSSGEIKYVGYFIDDRFCYLIELSKKGDTVNIDKAIQYNVIAQNKADRVYNLELNFGKKVNQLDSLEILYALYKVNDSNTAKITKQRFESVKSISKRIDIPFYIADTGLYYFKVAIPTIQDLKESHIIYDFPFQVNDSSIVKIENKNVEESSFITRF